MSNLEIAENNTIAFEIGYTLAKNNFDARDINILGYLDKNKFCEWEKEQTKKDFSKLFKKYVPNKAGIPIDEAYRNTFYCKLLYNNRWHRCFLYDKYILILELFVNEEDNIIEKEIVFIVT